MLLAIDIGNTNITCGIFKDSRIVKQFKIPAAKYSLAGLKRGLAKASVDSSIICSVVPAATVILEKDLKKLLGEAPYIIGKNIAVPVKNLYRKPKQLGSDRLVNAYAAIKLYGTPAVVVDFGTAITFDVVSKNGAYLGGVILPGLNVSLKALHQNTALVPQIKLKIPSAFIGGDTAGGILSGIVYGFAALSDNLTCRIKAYYIGKQAKVIGTGGDINLIAKYSKRFDAIDKDLTLKGLNILFEQERHCDDGGRVKNKKRRHV